MGGVRLRQPRPREHDVSEGLPRRVRQRPRRLSVRQDDAGVQVPRRCGQQLEAVHRRLRRVLPCADPAREAGHRRRVPEAGRHRVRGVGLRHRGAARHGVLVGRHVPAQGPRHGQADRAGAPQRAVRALGPSRDRGPRPAPAGPEPGAPQGVGHRLVRPVPELHAPDLGARVVPHVPLLADLLQHAHLRGRALLRPSEERDRAAPPGARRRHLQGVRVAGRQHARGDADDARVAGGDGVPAQRPGDPAPPPAQDRS